MTSKIIDKVKIDGNIYTYYLLKKNNEYGIRIRKNKKHKTLEKKSIYNIFLDKLKTIKFIEKIAKNTVSPVTLKEIVEDALI